MAKAGSPFIKGEAVAKRLAQEKEKNEERKKRMLNTPFRFWLDQGETGKVIFLDNPVCLFFEHNCKLEGKWHNYFTCNKEVGECPPCDAGSNAVQSIALSIIDLRKYKDKKTGETKRFTKKMLVFRGQAACEKIVKKAAKQKDLRFTAWEISRSTADKSPAQGDDLEFIKRLDVQSMLKFIPSDWVEKQMQEEGLTKKEALKKFLTPFDYETILAVRPLKELRQIFGTEAHVGDEELPDELEDDGLGEPEAPEVDPDDLTGDGLEDDEPGDGLDDDEPVGEAEPEIDEPEDDLEPEKEPEPPKRTRRTAPKTGKTDTAPKSDKPATAAKTKRTLETAEDIGDLLD